VAALPKRFVGLDARQVHTESAPRQRLVLLVIGETQRAANWGLNGYVRQTIPLLSQRNLVSFSSVVSCGTSTAVSVPCMFSNRGSLAKNSYAQNHESLLDVVQRAGIDVEWIDNQSGCKGVCDGVETDTLNAERFPESCPDGRCFDQTLVDDLSAELAEAAEAANDQLLVMHMMGSHGPAYYARYPGSFRRFFSPA
jgi:lipid A ethanolaminephosphotransferase